MAKVRWFLELFYIGNIDADYLRRFKDIFFVRCHLLYVLSMTFHYKVPDIDFRTTKKQKKT